MEIRLFLSEPYYDECELFEINGFDDNIKLDIRLKDSRSLEELLKDKDAFDRCVELKRECNDDDRPDEFVELDEQAIKYVYDHFDNILDSVDYIVLPYDDNDNIKYIKENPIVLTKKIVINERIGMTEYDRVLELMELYKDYLDQVYITVDGNEDFTKLTECCKTICEIRKKAETIKSLNLSKMETIMYVYDVVRNRVYQFENENEDYTKSRNLSEVLLGDKIVCVGYSNIFKALLDYIGIPSDIVCLYDDDEDYGHARNVVYVNDPKYNIDGVYYFDATWDSKKKDEDNHYLYSYKYFAKTRNYMDNEHMIQGLYFEDKLCPLNNYELFEKVEEIVESGEKEKLMAYYRQINYMAGLVHSREAHINPLQIKEGMPTKIYGELNLEEYFGNFIDLCDKFEREIPAETMLELFNNVRKIEFYQNPEWFPFDMKAYFNVFMKSDWDYDESNLSEEEKMFKKIFGLDDDVRARKFKKDMVNSHIPRDIAGVRIAKVLQKVVQKKQNENLQ